MGSKGLLTKDLDEPLKYWRQGDFALDVGGFLFAGIAEVMICLMQKRSLKTSLASLLSVKPAISFATPVVEIMWQCAP